VAPKKRKGKSGWYVQKKGKKGGVGVPFVGKKVRLTAPPRPGEKRKRKFWIKSKEKKKEIKGKIKRTPSEWKVGGGKGAGIRTRNPLERIKKR